MEKKSKEEKLQENKTSVDTFNEDKVENISVSNSKNTNKNQKQISGINPENLIVKADNTLARNDDISLNEEYKEIA